MLRRKQSAQRRWARHGLGEARRPGERPPDSPQPQAGAGRRPGGFRARRLQPEAAGLDRSLPGDLGVRRLCGLWTLQEVAGNWRLQAYMMPLLLQRPLWGAMRTEGGTGGSDRSSCPRRVQRVRLPSRPGGTGSRLKRKQRWGDEAPNQGVSTRNLKD